MSYCCILRFERDITVLSISSESNGDCTVIHEQEKSAVGRDDGQTPVRKHSEAFQKGPF